MCVCVCVQDFIQDFEFSEGGKSPKFGVDVEGCIAHNNSRGTQDFFKKLML